MLLECAGEFVRATAREIFAFTDTDTDTGAGAFPERAAHHAHADRFDGFDRSQGSDPIAEE